jgi:hypothetical protein
LLNDPLPRLILSKASKSLVVGFKPKERLGDYFSLKGLQRFLVYFMLAPKRD